MNVLNELQAKLDSRMKTDEPLARHNTFKIGGPAKYFFEAKTKEDVVKAVQAAEELQIPYFVLSIGSNVLISDKGFPGLVIKMQNAGFKVEGERIEAEAGLSLARLVQVGEQYGLAGIEFAATIPGSVGGAVRGNAGAYGKSIADVVEKVEYLEDGKLKVAEAGELTFAYRESMFKKRRGLIVLSATFKLQKGDPEASKRVVREYMEMRQKTQPIEFSSVGCVFKNIELIPGTLELKNPSQGSIPDKIKHLIPKDFKEKGMISAGWIIDEILGLKGKQIGQVKISEKHGNFIINLGQARAEDVMILISIIKQKARTYIGIQLQEEIELVGF